MAPILKTLASFLTLFKIPILKEYTKEREDCPYEIQYITNFENDFNVWRTYFLQGLAVVLLGVGLVLAVVLVILVISICVISVCGCGTLLFLGVVAAFPCISFCVKRRVKKQRSIEKQRLLQGLLEDKEMENVEIQENNQNNNLLEKVDLSIFNLNYDDYKIDKEIGKIIPFFLFHLNLNYILLFLFFLFSKWRIWCILFQCN